MAGPRDALRLPPASWGVEDGVGGHGEDPLCLVGGGAGCTCGAETQPCHFPTSIAASPADVLAGLKSSRDSRVSHPTASRVEGLRDLAVFK